MDASDSLSLHSCIQNLTNSASDMQGCRKRLQDLDQERLSREINKENKKVLNCKMAKFFVFVLFALFLTFDHNDEGKFNTSKKCPLGKENATQSDFI